MKKTSRVLVVVAAVGLLLPATLLAAFSHGTQAHHTAGPATHALENLDFVLEQTQPICAIHASHNAELSSGLTEIKEAHARKAIHADTLAEIANHAANVTDGPDGHSCQHAHADLLAHT